ncbi:MAG: PKD domain-containing protein [Bacteroidales bacterium]|nr:PKD domain-containing protein [Bacteroidales bacterium]
MKKIFTGIVILSFVVLMSFSTQTVHAQVNDTANFPYWIEMMQNPDVNYFQTVRAFETYWQGREITKGSGYKPFKRWEYWTGLRVSPEGKIPAPNKSMDAYNAFLSKSRSGSRDTDGEWTSSGPHTVPSGYNGYRGLGRVASIAFHPTNPDVIYLGAPAGGLWVTTDHGTTWNVLTDYLPTLGVSSIIVDEVTPEIIYIGTGDRDAGDAPGLGIWRSIDGGVTFEQRNSGIGNSTIGRMIQHPSDNQIILAATSTGIYKTVNAGETWTKTTGGNFKDIIFKPGDANVVYAASGGTFYRSTDNGDNFVSINNGLPGGARGVIGVTEANPEMVYFLITNGDSFKGLYRSIDGATSFEMRSTTPNIMSWDCDGGGGGQAWYDLDIAVDPNDADVIYGGGVNCFKSTDGGTTWAIRSHWYGGCSVESVHADLHILEVNPLNDRLFAGNDGGIYWTDDDGVNWTEITNGITISQAYKIGQSLMDRDNVINGYQDNGTSTMTTNEWISVGGGDGMECAYDPTDGTYAYSTIYYGSIDRIRNHNNQGGIAGNGVNGITESGGWVTPFVIDHNDGNIMFVGYKNVWRSTNIKAGSTGSVDWTKISTMGTSDMNVMAQSRANTDILYASSGNKLWMSNNVKDAEVTWTSLTSNLPTGNNITALETSPIDSNVVFMAQQTRIYKSEDKGLTWTNISGNLSNLQINSIAYYANSNNGLYLGTEVGVFYKDFFLDDWILYSAGMPASVRVTEIEIYYDSINPMSDIIRAGTYGRGLWSSAPYYTTLDANFEANTTNFVAGCMVDFTDLTQGLPSDFSWSFPGGTPSTSTAQNPQNIRYLNQGVYDVTLTVTDFYGTDTETRTGYIVVGAPMAPVVAFSASDTIGCVGQTVNFYDNSENCPTNWLWQFEPSTVSFLNWTSATSQNPTVRFNEVGDYTVTLTATNATGSNTIVKESYILSGGYGIPFVESFDGESINAMGWTVENPDNSDTWEISPVGDGAVWMNFFNYTNLGARDYLTSPALNLSDFGEAYLSFKYAYVQRANQMDSLIVSISTDCGATWQRVYANGPDGNGIFETAEPTMQFFEPVTEEDWCGLGYGADCPMIDISAFAGFPNTKIRFETYNNYGNNLYIKEMVVSNITSIASNIETEGVSVYPNPAHNTFSLNVKDALVGSSMILTDNQGREVLQQKITRNSTIVNIKGVAPGVYLLVLTGQHEVVNRKIVIR